MKIGDKVTVISNPIVDGKYTFHEFKIGDIVEVIKIWDELWITCRKIENIFGNTVITEQDLMLHWVE